jgi:putative copper resistance protein D
VLTAAVPGPPHWSDLFTQWRVDPLSLALLIGAAGGYLWYRARGRRIGLPWKARWDVTFGVGVAAGIWVSSGVAQARAGQLEWVWMAQALALLLVVPVIALAGQPVQLARDVTGEKGWTARVLRSRPVRVLGHPLVGPVLVPVVFLLILFAGVGQASAADPAAGWVLHVCLLVLGALIALPLVDVRDDRTSLIVGLALAIGAIELLMDAFPGIALRLAGHPVIPYFAAHTPSWAGGWLAQQHQAGGLLWIVAEVLDLPFMVLVAVRWLRVDAAEAALIDAELDAAEAARPRARPPAASGPVAVAAEDAGRTSPAAETDRPWFLDDPQLRDRYRY